MFYSFITSHIKSNDWLLGLSVKSCHCITNLHKKQTLLSFWKKKKWIKLWNLPHHLQVQTKWPLIHKTCKNTLQITVQFIGNMLKCPVDITSLTAHTVNDNNNIITILITIIIINGLINKMAIISMTYKLCWHCSFNSGWGRKLNPLALISDKDRISPDNINITSSRQLMRVKKNINLGITSWPNTKFSRLTSQELYSRQ